MSPRVGPAPTRRGPATCTRCPCARASQRGWSRRTHRARKLFAVSRFNAPQAEAKLCQIFWPLPRLRRTPPPASPFPGPPAQAQQLVALPPGAFRPRVLPQPQCQVPQAEAKLCQNPRLLTRLRRAPPLAPCATASAVFGFGSCFWTAGVSGRRPSVPLCRTGAPHTASSRSFSPALWNRSPGRACGTSSMPCLLGALGPSISPPLRRAFATSAPIYRPSPPPPTLLRLARISAEGTPASKPSPPPPDAAPSRHHAPTRLLPRAAPP